MSAQKGPPLPFFNVGSTTVVSGRKLAQFFPNVSDAMGIPIETTAYYCVFGDYPYHPVDADGFRAMTVRGFCEIKVEQRDYVLTTLQAADLDVLTVVIRVVGGLFGRRLTADPIAATTPQDLERSRVLIREGFVELDSITEGRRLRFAQASTSLQRDQLERNVLLSWNKRPCTFRIVLSRHTVVSVSGLVKLKRECSGVLSLLGYTSTPDGVPAGLLAYDSTTIDTGDEDTAPSKAGTFSFHTHPSFIIGKIRCFSSWPSGQDMRALTYSLFTTTPTLLHLIAGPEGLWTVSPNPVLQAAASRHAGVESAKTILLTAAHELYGELENDRSYDRYSPIRQAGVVKDFLGIVNSYSAAYLAYRKFDSLVALFSVTDQGVQDEPLFTVDFIPWKWFDDNDFAVLDLSYWPTPFLPLSMTPYIVGTIADAD